MSGVSTADVPARYDVVVSLSNGNTYGFMLADEIEPNLPFRSHKAVYNITPTFIDRSNISGSYGDNKQDFFMTDAQHDWSLGEQQRYFVGTDTSGASQRRYWRGQGVDVTVPGQVTMRQATKTLTSLATTIAASCSNGPTKDQLVYLADATNMYAVDVTGYVWTTGSHGLGSSPTIPFGMCADDSHVYLSASTVRKWDGSSFTSFSATGCSYPVFLNNALTGSDRTRS